MVKGRDLVTLWLRYLESRKPPKNNPYPPPGCQLLFDAIEDAGKALYPSEWDGSERVISEAKSKQVSEILGGPEASKTWGGLPALPNNLLHARSDAEIDAALVQLLDEKIAPLEATIDTFKTGSADSADQPHSMAGAVEPGGYPRATGSRPAKGKTQYVGEIDALKEDLAWCKGQLKKLPKMARAKAAREKIVSRRDAVEAAVRDTLYSGDVQVLYLDTTGVMKEMAHTVWGTNTGLGAMEGSWSGFTLLIKDGDLVRCVTGELQREMYASWARRTQWKCVDEAVPLSLGLDPNRHAPNAAHATLSTRPDLLSKYQERYSVIASHVASGDAALPPSDCIKLLSELKYDCPEDLHVAVEDAPSVSIALQAKNADAPPSEPELSEADKKKKKELEHDKDIQRELAEKYTIDLRDEGSVSRLATIVVAEGEVINKNPDTQRKMISGQLPSMKRLKIKGLREEAMGD